MKIWKNGLRLGCIALAAAMLLAGCQSAGETAEERDDLAADESTSAVSDSSEAVSDSSAAEEEGGNPMQAESEPLERPEDEFYPCAEHTSSYHTVILDLIGLVGSEAYYDWADAFVGADQYGRESEAVTIADYIRQFSVPQDQFTELVQGRATEERLADLGMTREEYLSQYGYTDEQIAALYSGDPAQVNAAFCGELAWYNEADGQLYSIYWLSGHTAADYQAAGVPVSEVERILEDAAAMGGSYASLAEAAAPAAEAYALE